MYVAADADLDRARSQGAVRACFSSAGQLCISVERLLVHEDVADEFLARVRAPRVRAMRLGAGPGLRRRHGQPLLRGPAGAGHRPRRGRPRPRAPRCSPAAAPAPTSARYFYEPTVLDGVTAAMALPRRGDVRAGRVGLPGPRRRRGRRAGQRHRLRPQRLRSGPATRARGRRLAARIQAGTVNVNEGYAAAWGSVAAPMGGMKSSGLSAAGTAPRASTSTPSPRTSRPSAWSASPRRSAGHRRAVGPRADRWR